MCRRLTVRSGSLVSVICISRIVILSTGKLVAVSAESLIVSAVSIVLLTGTLLSRVSVLISAGSLIAGAVSIVLLAGILLSRVSVLISAGSLAAGAVSVVLLAGILLSRVSVLISAGSLVVSAVSIVLLTDILRRLLILSGTLFIIVIHVAGVLRGRTLRRLLICILILRLRCCFLIHVVVRRLLGSRVVRVIIIHIVIFVHDDEFLSWLQNGLHYIPIVN